MKTFPIKLTDEQHASLKRMSYGAMMSMHSYVHLALFGKIEEASKCEHEFGNIDKHGKKTCKKCGDFVRVPGQATSCEYDECSLCKPKKKPKKESAKEFIDKVKNLPENQKPYKPEKEHAKKVYGYPKEKSLNKKK